MTTTPVTVSPDEVIAELGPMGQLEWRIAMLRATCSKLGDQLQAVTAERDELQQRIELMQDDERERDERV